MQPNRDVVLHGGVNTFHNLGSVSEHEEYMMAGFESLPEFELDPHDAWVNRYKRAYNYCNRDFCFYGYCAVLGFGWQRANRWGKTRFNSQNEEHISDSSKATHSRRQSIRERGITRSTKTRDFIDFYLDWFIEDYPDGTKSRLPMLVKKEVYNREYAAWMDVAQLACVGYAWFCELWRQMYGDALITDKRRFGQCSDCSALVRAYFLADSIEEKRELLLSKSAHIEHVRNCRREVTLWHAFAKLHPDEAVFMMMDGMDQNKTAIPKQGRYVYIWI